MYLFIKNIKSYLKKHDKIFKTIINNMTWLKIQRKEYEVLKGKNVNNAKRIKGVVRPK